MNLKEQQYMVALAAWGNMTAAAKQLGLSQPALSSYLANVEGGLGLPLFERRGRRLIPTYLGEVYLEKARKILALGEEFHKQREQVLCGLQGRLRVGIPLRRSPQFIPSAIKIFQQSHPNVDLSFQEGNQRGLLSLLQQDHLDLVLCNWVEGESDICYHPLCEDPVLFLVQLDHPCCRYGQYRQGCFRPWIDLKYFEQEVFILQHKGQSLHHYAQLALKETGVRPLRIQTIRNIETSAQMAAHGLGVSFCLASYLHHMRFVKPPQAFTFGDGKLAAHLAVAHLKSYTPPNYASEFIQLLQELLRLDLTW